MTWSEVIVWQRGNCSERSGGSGRDALARTGSSMNLGGEKTIAINMLYINIPENQQKEVLITAHF